MKVEENGFTGIYILKVINKAANARPDQAKIFPKEIFPYNYWFGYMKSVYPKMNVLTFLWRDWRKRPNFKVYLLVVSMTRQNKLKSGKYLDMFEQVKAKWPATVKLMDSKDSWFWMWFRWECYHKDGISNWMVLVDFYTGRDKKVDRRERYNVVMWYDFDKHKTGLGGTWTIWSVAYGVNIWHHRMRNKEKKLYTWWWGSACFMNHFIQVYVFSNPPEVRHFEITADYKLVKKPDMKVSAAIGKEYFANYDEYIKPWHNGKWRGYPSDTMIRQQKSAFMTMRRWRYFREKTTYLWYEWQNVVLQWTKLDGTLEHWFTTNTYKYTHKTRKREWTGVSGKYVVPCYWYVPGLNHLYCQVWYHPEWKKNERGHYWEPGMIWTKWNPKEWNYLQFRNIKVPGMKKPKNWYWYYGHFYWSTCYSCHTNMLETKIAVTTKV